MVVPGPVRSVVLVVRWVLGAHRDDGRAVPRAVPVRPMRAVADRDHVGELEAPAHRGDRARGGRGPPSGAAHRGDLGVVLRGSGRRGGARRKKANTETASASGPAGPGAARCPVRRAWRAGSLRRVGRRLVLGGVHGRLPSRPPGRTASEDRRAGAVRRRAGGVTPPAAGVAGRARAPAPAAAGAGNPGSEPVVDERRHAGRPEGGDDQQDRAEGGRPGRRPLAREKSVWTRSTEAGGHELGRQDADDREHEQRGDERGRPPVRRAGRAPPWRWRTRWR